MRLEEALKKTDSEWYKDLFKSHELRRLSEGEVAAVISASVKAAEEMWEKVKDDYEAAGPEALLKRYGVRVVSQDLNQATNLLAYYDLDSNTLRLQTQSIEAFGRRIEEGGCAELFPPENLPRMVLTHELYHVLEMNEPDVYTYRKLLPQKFLFFKWQERLATASEIGAYHFTKLALKLDFPPQFLEEL